jgi:hypothetical protein
LRRPSASMWHLKANGTVLPGDKHYIGYEPWPDWPLVRLGWYNGKMSNDPMSNDPMSNGQMLNVIKATKCQTAECRLLQCQTPWMSKVECRTGVIKIVPNLTRGNNSALSSPVRTRVINVRSLITYCRDQSYKGGTLIYALGASLGPKSGS